MNPATDIVEEITIQAPATRVYEALTNPEQRIKWWWSAQGRFQLIRVESDLRPGGKWMMQAIGMGEKLLTVSGEYRDVTPPKTLSFTWLPDWQPNVTETLIRWDLEEADGVTKVTLTHSGFSDEASRGTYRGWPAILGGLARYVTVSEG